MEMSRGSRADLLPLSGFGTALGLPCYCLGSMFTVAAELGVLGSWRSHSPAALTILAPLLPEHRLHSDSHARALADAPAPPGELLLGAALPCS